MAIAARPPARRSLPTPLAGARGCARGLGMRAAVDQARRPRRLRHRRQQGPRRSSTCSATRSPGRRHAGHRRRRRTPTSSPRRRCAARVAGWTCELLVAGAALADAAGDAGAGPARGARLTLHRRRSGRPSPLGRRAGRRAARRRTWPAIRCPAAAPTAARRPRLRPRRVRAADQLAAAGSADPDRRAADRIRGIARRAASPGGPRSAPTWQTCGVVGEPPGRPTSAPQLLRPRRALRRAGRRAAGVLARPAPRSTRSRTRLRRASASRDRPRPRLALGTEGLAARPHVRRQGVGRRCPTWWTRGGRSDRTVAHRRVAERLDGGRHAPSARARSEARQAGSSGACE